MKHDSTFLLGIIVEALELASDTAQDLDPEVFVALNQKKESRLEDLFQLLKKFEKLRDKSLIVELSRERLEKALSKE
jgi:hypothetical protein